jgi:proteasome accessory factor B
MFERDKDDLRSLGINIELGTFDPLFEDEAGYRIKPETYALQLENLNPSQIALLSKAAQMWREAALSAPAQSGLRKLKSLGIESDFETISALSVSVPQSPDQLPEIIEAISDKKRIRFEYFNQELKPLVRNVEPYRLSNSRGFWYLIGKDRDINEMRTFRVDRFASSVSIASSANAFSIDQVALDVIKSSQSPSMQIAEVRVRKGRGVALRAHSQHKEIDSEWDLLEVGYHSVDYLISQVLWLGEDAQIMEPDFIREEVISRLQEMVKSHG